MLRNPYEKTNRLISPPRIRINEVFKASYKIRLFGYSWGYLPIKIDKIASFSMFLFLDLASLKPPDPHLMLSLSKTPHVGNPRRHERQVFRQVFGVDTGASQETNGTRRHEFSSVSGHPFMVGFSH